MNDQLRRLVDESDSAFTRELLSSAADDSPEPCAKLRARSALGASALGLTVMATSGLGSSAPAGVAGAAAAPASAGTAATVVGLGGVTLKWSVPLVVALAAGAAGGVAYMTREEPTSRHFVVGSVATPPAHSADVSRPEAAPEPPEVVTSPSAPTAPVTRSVPPRAVKPERTAAPALAEEIAAMDAARRALALGDRSLLDGYLARYPRGVFREQGLALRVRALVRAGQVGQARAEARAFLSAYPRSADAGSMRRVIGE